jgi:hypothetical protein
MAGRRRAVAGRQMLLRYRSEKKAAPHPQSQ